MYIPWAVPGITVFSAPDEATLEKYRAQYEMITQNAVIRNEFNYVKQAYGSQIRNMLMQQQANSIAAMTEAQAQSYLNDYDSSGYTWTTGRTTGAIISTTVTNTPPPTAPL